jgi:hypothetical protein
LKRGWREGMRVIDENEGRYEKENKRVEGG